jgi:V/A-type H+-transporting ATPase subunit D
MERLLISVNKSNLLRLREELSFAKDGLELLNEKKEGLMVHIATLSTKAERVRVRVNDMLQNAYGYLRDGILFYGRLSCERASLAVALEETVEIKERSFMGVALPNVSINLPRLIPPYGFYGTGAAMDAVMKVIREGLEVIAELAEIEVGLFRLVTELKKTIKRLNALENIYVPVYQSTVKYIEENLEEKEREFLFQLKRRKHGQKRTDHGPF